LRVEIDHTSTNYRYVVLDERNRWLRVCETRQAAEEFIKTEADKEPGLCVNCGLWLERNARICLYCYKPQT
jgi:hypothetical protein